MVLEGLIWGLHTRDTRPWNQAPHSPVDWREPPDDRTTQRVNSSNDADVEGAIEEGGGERGSVEKGVSRAQGHLT